MGTKLYVGNISWGIKEDALKAAFDKVQNSRRSIKAAFAITPAKNDFGRRFIQENAIS